MPRYFFHVRDGQYAPDLSGTLCESDEHARSEAILWAIAMISELGSQFFDIRGWQMRVEEEGGRQLFTLYFSGLIVAAE
ncbi:DUF6894 family protein [Devosia rhizoryzae]|uniref:DUF6894 domain-containing protein n=1 Tax=Devosia rhizoryzae TaxID=2774137 RepID=A0ABX7CAS1_9HYPH|nr:hypothetical protein [Devosia rhizoryzae]QQR39700.1 hypothetical protein JI748_01380 [Devosia rhizoryzae]